VQSTGDGIFALFGAPVADEDHPQRALYIALRMRRFVLAETVERRNHGLKREKSRNLLSSEYPGGLTGKVLRSS
jgi:class 3 adenylate cyclase